MTKLTCDPADVEPITRNKVPKFYQEVLESWFTFKGIYQTDVNDKLDNQIIWCNSNIKLNNNVILSDRWKDAGILYLSDIIMNDRLISLAEINQIIKCPENIFTLQKIITALPRHWKMLISNKKVDLRIPKNHFMFTVGKKEIHISNLSTKHIYKTLLKSVNTPMCVNYWQNSIGLSKIENWNKIFVFKIKNRITNKLGHFQINVLYNLIPCGKNLFKWKVTDSDKCVFCDLSDDYDHFFISCKKNKCFWKLFEQVIYTLKNCFLDVSLHNIIYGWNIENLNFEIENILIIIASFSVYKAKMIFNETKQFTPITLFFKLEIKKLDELFLNIRKRTKYSVTNTAQWKDLKVYLNLK